jgi:hypothetical protein
MANSVFSGTRNDPGRCQRKFGNAKGDVMKTLLGALVAIMLLGAVTAVPAQAHCWDTPQGLRCSQHWNGGPWHPHYWRHWGY